MTEERKKALAEKTTLVLIECDFNASKELAVVTKLIEIVAAEAREEGLEEGRDIAIAAFETDIDSTCWDLNRIRVFIQEAIAERLKADGKR